jgi:hypothetical protein
MNNIATESLFNADNSMMDDEVGDCNVALQMLLVLTDGGHYPTPIREPASSHYVASPTFD